MLLMKGAFGPFKSLSPDDIRFSQELRAHGQRVLTTIDKLMCTRDDTSSMVMHLHELGQRHVTYSVKVDYIDVRLYYCIPTLTRSLCLIIQQ